MYNMVYRCLLYGLLVFIMIKWFRFVRTAAPFLCIISISCQDQISALPVNLIVWIHGTAANCFLPNKLTGKIRGKVEIIHFDALHQDSDAKKKAVALQHGDDICFNTSNFYRCNWSGFLDYKEREYVAEKLYDFLVDKVNEITADTGKRPSISIITHSHGGNIALTLAKYNNKHGGDDLVVDRLILMACPVQKRTADFANHQTFKKIYAFYSPFDPIQLCAMQGFLAFSGRKFAPGPNIVQIRTYWNHIGLWHNQFNSIWFARLLPALITKTDSGGLDVGERIGEYILRL